MVRWIFILLYFTGVKIVRRIQGDDILYPNLPDDECNKPVAERIIMLFFAVIIPCFAILSFGAVNFFMYKHNTLKRNELSPKLLNISQYSMIVKTLWLLIGFTIWSMRNIVYIIILFNRNCMNGSDTVDKFWLVNFYVLSLLGLVLAIISLIVFPLFGLYKCYESTDRHNESNPYN